MVHLYSAVLLYTQSLYNHVLGGCLSSTTISVFYSHLNLYYLYCCCLCVPEACDTKMYCANTYGQ